MSARVAICDVCGAACGSPHDERTHRRQTQIAVAFAVFGSAVAVFIWSLVLWP